MTTKNYNTYSAISIGIFSVVAFFGGYDYTSTSVIEAPIKVSSLKDEELTNLCMNISEQALAKVWDNEDDEYWASYLNA